MRLTPEQQACLRLLAIEHSPIESRHFWPMMSTVGLFYHTMVPLAEARLLHRAVVVREHHITVTYVITDTGRAALSHA